MGSLIGSIYAVSPPGDLRTRYRELMAEYVRLSREQSAKQAGLFGLGAAILSGGTLAILGAASAGGLMVEPINLDRFRTAMILSLQRSPEYRPLPLGGLFAVGPSFGRTL
jgi:hypothetical protein